jgi:hypothetical protein
MTKKMRSVSAIVSIISLARCERFKLNLAMYRLTFSGGELRFDVQVHSVSSALNIIADRRQHYHLLDL